MTRYDLKFAGLLAAVVIAVGLMLGYAVGYFARPDVQLLDEPPKIAPSFDIEPVSGAKIGEGSTVPGYQEIHVNDYAGLLDEAAEERIRQMLIAFYDQAGVEMTVLTIERMTDFDHFGQIESFATQVFNTWGIGNASRNDGILVLVARFDRMMRIELGAGYARSRDAQMKTIIEDDFLPRFRVDDYQGGIEDGVEAIITRVSGAAPGQMREISTVERGGSTIWGWVKSTSGLLLGALVVPLVPVIIWVRRHLRYRPRRCEKCQTLMRRAGKEAEDEHLDGGQLLEEYLKTVDYDVWHCPNCAHIDIHSYPAWFAGHGACKQCNYRTMKTDSTVLHQATKTSTGSKRLDYSCDHCGFKDNEIRTIPVITSSSSSGSGGSSFGGGSSSGGGASGSW